MTELKITIGEPFEAVLERAEAAEHAWRTGRVSEPPATHLNFGP